MSLEPPVYPRFVGVLERDISELIENFPKLARAEVLMAIECHGPDRERVEAELRRLSFAKS